MDSAAHEKWSCMPGRDDFAIIRARLLADPRARSAARAYVALGLAVKETSLGTIVGHVACLGVWASRETDDGVLPGDGVAAFIAATYVQDEAAERCVAALVESGLLRPSEGGYYVTGFLDCYRAILAKREADRARIAKKRAARKGDDEMADDGVLEAESEDVAAMSQRRRNGVAATSQRCRDVPYRTGPDREESPLTPTGEGGESASPSLSDTDRAVFGLLWSKRDRFLRAEATRAAALHDSLLTDLPNADGVRAFIAELTPRYAEEVRQLVLTFRMRQNAARAEHGARRQG